MGESSNTQNEKDENVSQLEQEKLSFYREQFALRTETETSVCTSPSFVSVQVPSIVTVNDEDVGWCRWCGLGVGKNKSRCVCMSR